MKRTATSKKLIYFLFINCVAIELFTMGILIWNMALAVQLGAAPDYSPINALIGTVVTETVGYVAYAIKSTIENREGGITYLNAKYDLDNREEGTDDGDSNDMVEQ